MVSIVDIRRAAELLNISPTREPQRNYMWEVSVVSDSRNSFRDLQFFAKTITIPQRARENFMLEYMDRKFPFAGRDSSGHVATLQCWDDESLQVLRYMDTWMSEMGDQQEHRSVDKDQYSRKIIIKLKDTTDLITTAKIELTNAYPIDIPDITLNYEAGEIIEIPITFSFDQRILDDSFGFDIDLRSLLKTIL